MQDTRKPTARCHPTPAQYADLETGRGAGCELDRARKRTKRKQAQAGSCKLYSRLVSPLRTSKLPTWRRNDFELVGRSQLRNAPLFDLFKSPPYHDSRSDNYVLARPLAWLAQGRKWSQRSIDALWHAKCAPGAGVGIAREVKQAFASWRPAIERALFEHYEPYAEAIAGGAVASVAQRRLTPNCSSSRRLGSCVVSLSYPSRRWAACSLPNLDTPPFSGDEEHTLGARFQLRKVHRTVAAAFCVREGDPCWPASSRAGGSIWGAHRGRVEWCRRRGSIGSWVNFVGLDWGEQCSRSCFSPVGSLSGRSVPVSRCECFATVHFGLAAID